MRPPRGARVGIVRCHIQHVYGLRTYYFSNLYNFPLNKIGEAVEPVNPYENLTATSSRRPRGGRTERGIWHMGSIDPSQAKCELGINYIRYRKGTSIRQAPVFRHLRALRKSPWKCSIWMNELYLHCMLLVSHIQQYFNTSITVLTNQV